MRARKRRSLQGSGQALEPAEREERRAACSADRGDERHLGLHRTEDKIVPEAPYSALHELAQTRSRAPRSRVRLLLVGRGERVS